MNRRVVSIIPARKGSKRYKNKNIEKFCGHPLALWTFAFADNSGIFDVNYVNTDILELQNEVERHNNFKFCVRPDELAGDTSTLLDVIRYTCESEGLDDNDIVVLLPVTGPLRTVQDINSGIEAFLQDDRNTVVSVSQSEYPAGMLWKKDDIEQLHPLFPEEMNRTTQKQRHFSTFQFNDLFVIDSVAGFLQQDRDLYGKKPIAQVIPPERTMPIDYRHQFYLAEHLFKLGQTENVFPSSI